MSTRPARTPSYGRRLEKRAKAFWLPLACRLIAPRDSQRRSREQLRREIAAARRILVIRQDNRLGNMVLITPFLKELRRLAPEAHIAALVDSRFSDVVNKAPWLDNLIIQHRKQMIYRPWEHPLHLRALRRGGWDIAFDLSNPDSFSSHSALVLAAAGAGCRIGFAHPRARHAINIPVSLPETECHYSLAPLLLLSACGLEPQLTPMSISPALIPPVESGNRPIIINPGGRGAKRWPTDQFIALIDKLIDTGTAPVDQLLLLGGPAEIDLLQSLQSRFSGIEIRCLSRLDELVELLHGSRLYIGCDAGPLHVAAALAVPTLSLFLTSNPFRYAPLGEHHETILAGSGSRRQWRERSAFKPSDITSVGAAMCEPYPYAPEFGERLFSSQPVLTTPPDGMQPPADVEFVFQRILRRLQKESYI